MAIQAGQTLGPYEILSAYRILEKLAGGWARPSSLIMSGKFNGGIWILEGFSLC